MIVSESSRTMGNSCFARKSSLVEPALEVAETSKKRVQMCAALTRAKILAKLAFLTSILSVILGVLRARTQHPRRHSQIARGGGGGLRSRFFQETARQNTRVILCTHVTFAVRRQQKFYSLPKRGPLLETSNLFVSFR